MSGQVQKYMGVSLFALSIVLMSSFSYAALEAENKESCENLGYNTDLDDCVREHGIPLLCPFYEKDDPNRKVICLTDACRGYGYLEADFEKKASDGRTYNEHVKSKETCVVGKGADAITYYRVKECKEGSLYQNGLCDVGCDKISKYPFDSHPGNLAGEVETCIDTDGSWYGYTRCNDGWTLDKGRCSLNTCDIKQFPYISDPNVREDRGATSICKIGGNGYYRYVDVDDEGRGLCSQKGYELKKAVCAKKCEINTSGCRATENSVTHEGTTRTYKNWKCSFKTTNCRIGDYATINGEVIGIIFHLPDADDSRTLILSDNGNSVTRKWGDGVAETTDTPLTNKGNATLAKADMDGKANTMTVVNFRDIKGSDYKYPAVEFCQDYTVTGCTHDMCKQGEWYLPSEGELGYMFDNRYVLYNVTGSTTFYSNYFWSSTEYSYYYAWALGFLNGLRWNLYKNNSGYVRPVLAF